jgi:monofunctional biosynthetic peptidoglycan transglycosylase
MRATRTLRWRHGREDFARARQDGCVAAVDVPARSGSRRSRGARARPKAVYRGRVTRRVVRWLWAVPLGAVLLSVAAVGWLRVFPPLTTAFAVQWRMSHGAPAQRRWASWDEISPHLAVAVIAAEDQRFPVHRGFDLQAIEDALEERRTRGRVRGASTISQQVAKNLFLWPGRSWVRKGLEAWLTAWIELLWPKRRILEMYLNVAQLGRGVFGAEAAARAFFGKPARALTREEAALLAAVLPDPVRLAAERPSPYVLERRAWILRQMQALGGTAYLDALDG